MMFLSSPVKVTFPTPHFEDMADATEFYAEHRDDILQRCGRCGERCWWWWQVDSPQPRDEARDEAEQLFRMAELTSEEIEALKHQHPDGIMPDLPFRRHWTWWQWYSPTPRDETISEARQLMRLKLLTDVELAILNDPAKATRKPVIPCSSRTRFYYLGPDELQLVGFPAGSHTLFDDT